MRLTKIQATTRPAEVWSKIGKAAQQKEKQEWANEKPKADNAQKLKCIYFIDPEDGEYKENFKQRREKVGGSDEGGYALQERDKEALRVSGNSSEE